MEKKEDEKKVETARDRAKKIKAEKHKEYLEKCRKGRDEEFVQMNHGDLDFIYREIYMCAKERGKRELTEELAEKMLEKKMEKELIVEILNITMQELERIEKTMEYDRK